MDVITDAVDAARLGKLDILGRLLLDMGNMRFMRAEYVPAIAAYEEAQVVCRSTEDKWGIAWSLRLLAEIQLERGEYEDAIPKMEEARSQFDSMGHRSDTACCLRDLGRMQLELGDRLPAVVKLQEAIKTFRELDERLESAITLRMLGEADIAGGDYDQATSTLETTMSEFEAIGDRRSTAQGLRSVGNLLRAQKKYGEADGKLGEAAEFFRNTSQSWELAFTLQVRGQNAIEALIRPDAVASLEEAISLFTKLGVPKRAEECRKMLDSFLTD